MRCGSISRLHGAVRSGDGIHVKVQEGANAESFQAGMDVLENEAKIIRALSEETILAETGDFLLQKTRHIY